MESYQCKVTFVFTKAKWSNSKRSGRCRSWTTFLRCHYEMIFCEFLPSSQYFYVLKSFFFEESLFFIVWMSNVMTFLLQAHQSIKLLQCFPTKAVFWIALCSVVLWKSRSYRLETHKHRRRSPRSWRYWWSLRWRSSNEEGKCDWSCAMQM